MWLAPFCYLSVSTALFGAPCALTYMTLLYSTASEHIYHRIIIDTSKYMARVHSYTVSFLTQQTQFAGVGFVAA